MDKITPTLLIHHANQVVTVAGGSEKPKTGPEMADLGVIDDGAVAVVGDRIALVGGTEEVMNRVNIGPDTQVLSAKGKTVLPGLIDPHTHLIFAGSRENELDQKLKGVPYLEILAQGGGILSTVRATRAASDEELTSLALERLDTMLLHGTTTVEAKSGYGLSTTEEIRELHILSEVAARHPLHVEKTFMGAHAIPPELSRSSQKYVELIITEMLPQIAQRSLARFCDVFCEEGVFSVEETRKILQAAKGYGLIPKIHADEMVPLGGAELAAEVGAISADHLLFASEQGIRALAKAQVVAVLLPGTSFSLMVGKYAAARTMIEAGVPVALATDFNPGSCPCPSMQMVMTLATLGMKLTPAEVITAATINAAHAIGLAHDIGSIEPDKRADLAIFNAPNYRYICYQFGVNQVDTVIKNGRVAVLAGRRV